MIFTLKNCLLKPLLIAILPYSSTKFPPPLEKIWRLYGRVTFSSFPPLYDDQDSQKAKFCNFKWDVFALIYTLRFCLNIHSFNFALIYIFLMKMTYKNDPQSIFSERRQKNFYGRVSLLFFRGEGKFS